MEDVRPETNPILTDLHKILNLFLNGYKIHVVLGRRANERHLLPLPPLPSMHIWVCIDFMKPAEDRGRTYGVPTTCHHLLMDFDDASQTSLMPDGFVQRFFVDSATIQHMRDQDNFFATVQRILVFGGTLAFPYYSGGWGEREALRAFGLSPDVRQRLEYLSVRSALMNSPDVKADILYRTSQRYKALADKYGFVNFRRHYQSAADPFPIYNEWLYDDRQQLWPWYSMSKVG